MADLSRYYDLITSEHRVRPHYMAWVQALLKILGDIDDLLQSMPDAFRLETAVGKQLDILADLVGVVRGEYDDDQLRTLIKAAILRNTWDGTTEQLYQIWELVFPDIKMQVASNTGMKKVVIIIGDPSESDKELILSGLVLPVAAGVGLRFQLIEDPNTPIFAFDTDGTVTYLGPWDVGYWDAYEGMDTGTQQADTQADNSEEGDLNGGNE